jgi:hypothetical protein
VHKGDNELMGLQKSISYISVMIKKYFRALLYLIRSESYLISILRIEVMASNTDSQFVCSHPGSWEKYI